MATIEEINNIKRLIENNKSTHKFEKIQLHRMGIEGVLKLLYESDKPLKSIELCNKLNISSARMAVIIKKLESRELITKNISINDARVIQIELTNKGKIKYNELQDIFTSIASNISDNIGYNKLKEFTNIYLTIEQIIEEEFNKRGIK